MSPKVRHIEDYEIRMQQLTELQRLWYVRFLKVADVRDSDVRRCQEAIGEAEKWRGRCYQLESLLRVLRRDEEGSRSEHGCVVYFPNETRQPQYLRSLRRPER